MAANQNDFSYYWSTFVKVTSILLMNFESIALSVPEKKFKIDFQDGRNLRFPIGMIWVIIDLQDTPMLPTKFRVNWPFGSEEEAKNRFSRWPSSWISDRNDFSYFLSTFYLFLSGRTMDDAWRTLTDQNSSPWAIRAQVS